MSSAQVAPCLFLREVKSSHILIRSLLSEPLLESFLPNHHGNGHTQIPHCLPQIPSNTMIIHDFFLEPQPDHSFRSWCLLGCMPLMNNAALRLYAGKERRDASGAWHVEITWWVAGRCPKWCPPSFKFGRSKMIRTDLESGFCVLVVDLTTYVWSANTVSTVSLKMMWIQKLSLAAWQIMFSNAPEHLDAPIFVSSEAQGHPRSRDAIAAGCCRLDRVHSDPGLRHWSLLTPLH